MSVSQTSFAEVFDLSEPPEVEIPAVTAIVLCHNEALRLPYFLEHHKAAGVGRFLVVDNGSDDGSAEILDADPCVTRFPSARAYSECKSLWRQVLADHYLDQSWVMFPDVDELFVYPGWPDLSLPDYLSRVDARGYEALFSIMVDMYPDVDLTQVSYTPGAPFLDTAPMFDTENYRLRSYGASSLRSWPVPEVAVRGGARERLFHPEARTVGLRERLTRWQFSLNRSLTPGTGARMMDKLIGGLTDRRSDQGALPNMSKVPMLKWRRGCRFNGGVHRISMPLAVAPDICALLHFKYFDDFANRAEYAAARGQHVEGARHYRNYAARSSEVFAQSMVSAHSRRFDGVQSLVAAGLMRDVLSHSN